MLEKPNKQSGAKEDADGAQRVSSPSPGDTAKWNAFVEQSTSMGGFLLDPRKGLPGGNKIVELMHAVRTMAIARHKERMEKGFGALDEEHRAKIRAIWDGWGKRDAEKAYELLWNERERHEAELKAAGDETNYADFKRETSILSRAREGKDPLG